MGKTILVISSSPRKNGNSELLCDRFIEGATESGNTAEKISLREKDIHFCKACDACKANAGTCVQRDDMAAILEKMLAADVLVLATPVYFYAVSGQLKTLMDRCYARYEEMRGKECYFMLTAAVPGRDAVQRAVEDFRGFVSCLPDAVEKGVVYGTGAWNKGDIRGTQAMDEAYALGKSV
ncbi:flavodoxin family protein [Desulfosarcina sp. OttesenSCG-928-G10]|nr:flavodoxin family protein [Desulfosarcina sp. OttesenSCG-928-G10]MDL2320902.1 flavodoxin family protein [Desulfosarcina sp. OttesenSCG-928-B08]